MTINRLTALVVALLPTLALAADPPPKPIRVLLVCGGCCHDYAKQKDILAKGIAERANVEVTIAYDDDKGTKHFNPVYANEDWAKNFDIVIHDECTADVKDPAVISRILDPHKKGLPAVNLHCAMHSYRSGTWTQPVKAGDANARWFEFTGIQSSGHGAQAPIRLALAPGGHPVGAGFVPYTTGSDELYNNLTTFDVTPVLTGVQPDAPAAADRDKRYVVAWTHEYGPKRARVFSTTLAHNIDVMADPRYLDLVARGVLWAAGRL